jgi:hypothetical protein
MKLIVTLSITAIMTVHAVLGCCSHHEHHSAALPEGLNSHHACHDHHDHSCRPQDSPAAPQDCDEENCIFFASKHNTFQSLDLEGFCSALANSTLPELHFQGASFLRIAPADAIHPAGPALHIWQCVWVI